MPERRFVIGYIYKMQKNQFIIYMKFSNVYCIVAGFMV